MANRTKEEVEMENKILRRILFPCKTCRGTGKVDDASPYDMVCNTWECPDCEGFNADQAKRDLNIT